MATLYLDPIEETSQLLPLIQTAIQNEINRLELAIKIAHKRLIPFEKKYNVTSEKFIADMAAEDLAGGDDEYIHWAGEFKLKERLHLKLNQLRTITYASAKLPQPN